MKRKRILFVHYNSGSTGSLTDSLLKFATTLKREHDVLFMIPESGVFSQRIKHAGFPIISSKFTERKSTLNYLSECLRFIKLLKHQNINIIYICDYVYWKPAQLLAAKLLDIPHVAHIRFYKNEPELKGYLKDAACIIINSSKTAAVFYNNSKTAPKTHILYNFINIQDYTQSEFQIKQLRQNLGFTLREPLIGFVGALKRIKGVEDLIRATPHIISRHPNAKIIIVGGEVDDGYESELTILAHSLGVGGSIRFLGHRDDIPDLMASLDPLVVPSHDEPFGYINIEAGAAGRPVVATNIGGIPEIVLHRKPGSSCPLGHPGKSLTHM